MKSHPIIASAAQAVGRRSRRSLARLAVAFPLLMLMAGLASAQSITAEAEYQKKIHAASTINAAGEGIFGNRTADSTGKTEFVNVDIDVSGNSGLPVQLGRRLPIDWHYLPEQLGGFGNWDIEVPYIQTTVSSNMGWSVASASSPNRYKRCSFPGLPFVEGLLVNPEEVSQGYRLHVPGMGDEPLLVDNTVNIDPANGASHPWVLKSMGRLGCLPTVKNGYPGEGFYLLTTGGVKYYFDYPVERAALTVRKGPKGLPGYSVARKNVYLLATRIEDRFGNYVNYTYVNGQLTGIAANDGRQISLQYGSNLVTATSHGRTWTYALQNGNLTTVTNPDGSTWQYSPYGFGGLYNEPQSDSMGLSYFDPANMCMTESDRGRYAGEFPFAVKHPSGAQATFKFDGRRFHRSRVPYLCFIDFFDHQVKVAGQPINFVATGIRWNNVYDDVTKGDTVEAAIVNYDSQMLTEDHVDVSGYARIGTPNYFDVFSLKSITVSGAGVGSQVTSYAYQEDTYPYCNMYDHQTNALYGLSCQEDPCADLSCGDGVGRTTTITLPSGTVVKKRYGVVFEKNEGMLLSEQVLDAGGVQAQRTDYTYVQDEQMAQQPFPDEPGYGFNDRMESKWRPLVSTVLQRDGVTYSNIVNSFDALARPVSITRSSNISYGYSRGESIAYHDNLSKWVLGQVASVSTAGAVPSETGYDPATALPVWSKQFGALRQTLTYNPDGTVATVKDGNNNLTVLSNWKRGVPQTIQHPATPEAPAGSTETAVVNDAGWITSVTDENGYATTYGYDSMGRVSSIAYPADDSIAWNATIRSFEQVNVPELGLPAGHWRQSVSTGNARHYTYYDALWRPVASESYDVADFGNTRTQTFRRYDSAGRLVFASYPTNSGSDFQAVSAGVSTDYDALGRPIATHQSSELGTLSATTQYLTGGEILTTDARGQQTRTRYAAWDEPTTDYPIEIIHPEGAFTQIWRDAFFKPTQVRRSGTFAGQTVEAVRKYYYDGYHRLCRTDEPETGSTVMGHDGNDNVVWSASGLSGLNASDCDHLAAYNGGRTVSRSYDARNRLGSLSFPDGLGNQTWSYTKDGLPAQVTTYNGAGNTLPVVNAYHYNKRRLLDGQGETVSQSGWYAWGLGYGYDANGSLAAHTYPTGLTVSYAPNALGQPTQAGSYATGVKYYPNGAISQFTYGNGVVHAMAQNARQLPQTVSDVGVAGYTYTYDRNGNTTRIDDLAQGINFYRYLDYDGLDRLISAGSAMFGGSLHRIDYAYDAIDNLRAVTHAGVREHSYWYDSKNHLTNVINTGGATVIGLGYDPQGNLNDKNGQQYGFDYGNRLRYVPGKENYRYDALGRRVETAQDDGTLRLFQYSQAGQYMFGWKKTPAGAETTQENVYLGGSLVATIDHDWPSNAVLATKYQHTDALGSPVATTDAGGALIDRTHYEPYGSAINKTVDGIGYTGHVMDAATGLTYMQQRYYDPTLGRFLSVDPVTADSGTGSNFNRYKYALNNPYRFIDPDGRDDKEAAAALSRLYAQTQKLVWLPVSMALGADVTYTSRSGSGEIQSAHPELLFLGAASAAPKGAQAATEVTAGVVGEAGAAGGGALAARSLPTIKVLEETKGAIQFTAQGSRINIEVIADISQQGKILTLKGLHVEGAGKGASSLSALRDAARALGESRGASTVIIHGSVRSTGANPGKIPIPIIIKVN